MRGDIWKTMHRNSEHGNLKFIRENATPRHSRFSGEFEGHRRWRRAERLALAAACLLGGLWLLDVLRQVYRLVGG